MFKLSVKLVMPPSTLALKDHLSFVFCVKLLTVQWKQYDITLLQVKLTWKRKEEKQSNTCKSAVYSNVFRRSYLQYLYSNTIIKLRIKHFWDMDKGFSNQKGTLEHLEFNLKWNSLSSQHAGLCKLTGFSVKHQQIVGPVCVRPGIV